MKKIIALIITAMLLAGCAGINNPLHIDGPNEWDEQGGGEKKVFNQ